LRDQGVHEGHSAVHIEFSAPGAVDAPEVNPRRSTAIPKPGVQQKKPVPTTPR
jgi:hypothetical protein